MHIDQKWHSLIIGQKGGTIKEITQKYPSVSINFPRKNEDSNTVKYVVVKRLACEIGHGAGQPESARAHACYFHLTFPHLACAETRLRLRLWKSSSSSW